MATHGGRGTEEQKRKASDCFRHCNMSSSPRMCTSMRKDWPESFPNDNDIGDEDKRLGRCLTSLAGSGPPSTSICSTTGNEHIVEELTFGDYKNPNLPFKSHPLSPKQPQGNQLGNESGYMNLSREILPQDGENMPIIRLSKEIKRNASDFWSLKSLSCKKMSYDPEKGFESISNRDKAINSSNALLISSTMQNTASTCNFSPLVLKQKLKGKGVLCKDGADNTIEPNGALIGQEDETSTFITKFYFDKLLRSNADGDDKPSWQKFVLSSAESSDDGINLREWLISSEHRLNKYGRLYIFKQILEFADFAHSQGVVLQDLRPSYFTVLSSRKVKYIGSLGQGELYDVMTCNVTKKRPLEEGIFSCLSLGAKQQKLHKEVGSLGQLHHFSCNCGCRTRSVNGVDSYTIGSMNSRMTESVHENCFGYQHTSIDEQQFIALTVQLEEKWYSRPEVLNDGGCTFSSNIYSLGVLFFEFLCNIESWEAHSAAMLDLRHRILPPKFLSENPKEAGFCLWLLHPEPSSRPNTRMILGSEIIREVVELNSEDDTLASDDDEAQTEQLLSFLISFREEKQKQAAKLAEELNCLDEDIEEVERTYSVGTASLFPLEKNNVSKLSRNSFHMQDPFGLDISRSVPTSSVNEARLMRNISQLETAYFSMRSQILLADDAAIASYDKDVLNSRWRLSQVQNDNEEQRTIQRPVDCLGSFFESLCKFARYSKFEERGTLRNRDLLNSANVICALSFDRDEDYIAAAGVSKKIKIFDVSAILSNSVDIQYPIIEMSNNAKLSCVCWNSFIKNHLASTDYDGVVQMWDADTGQPFSQYTEHQKRAWSIHFSEADPKMFASGSDDCSVKLWNINERNSVGTIWNPANVCCVQFSAYSTNLLVFGSADYKIYGYDLRHTRIPWCTLSGHGKAVSYVKFLDSETLASASTDNSLKLWGLKKTSSFGLSSGACGLTFKGHTNEKNFVGLSVLDGYIACGSETNEVYCYHRSLPVPITSHKFGLIDPVSGHENNDDSNGQFVSSVCWRKKSNMLVAANSIGVVKLLKMV